jgi:hypothetical protein
MRKDIENCTSSLHLAESLLHSSARNIANCTRGAINVSKNADFIGKYITHIVICWNILGL